MENDSRVSTALLNENRDQDVQSKKKGDALVLDEDASRDMLEQKQNNQTKVKSSFKIIVLGDSGVGKTCLSFRFCAGRFPLTSEATIGLDFREKVIELDGQRLKLQLWDTAGQERFRRSITHHYYRNVDAVVFVYDVNSVSSFSGLDAWLEEVNVHGIPEAVPRILVGNKCDMGKAAVDTRQAQRQSERVCLDLPKPGVLSSSNLQGSQEPCWWTRSRLRYRRPARPRYRPGRPVTSCPTSQHVGMDLAGCTDHGTTPSSHSPHRWADDRNMPLFETSAKDDCLADHVDGIFLTLAHKVRHKKPLIRPVCDPSSPGLTAVRLVYSSQLAADGGAAVQEPGCCF